MRSPLGPLTLLSVRSFQVQRCCFTHENAERVSEKGLFLLLRHRVNVPIISQLPELHCLQRQSRGEKQQPTKPPAVGDTSAALWVPHDYSELVVGLQGSASQVVDTPVFSRSSLGL